MDSTELYRQGKTSRITLDPDDDVQVGSYVAKEQGGVVLTAAQCPYCKSRLIGWPDARGVSRVVKVDGDEAECVDIDLTRFIFAGCAACELNFVVSKEGSHVE